jgi:D-lactate dehydrogenase
LPCSTLLQLHFSQDHLTMNILIYSTKDFEKEYLVEANKSTHKLTFITAALSTETASLAKDHDAVFVFTGDDVSAPVLKILKEQNVRIINTRAAGFDNIDMKVANELGLKVTNVPRYSPYAIAEHAVALMLALNRKLVLANSNAHAYNFTLNELVGFDLHNKTVGIIGTGIIGSVLAKILDGFGCRLVGFDTRPNTELTKLYGMTFTDLPTLCMQSDIISLHVPLNEHTHYMINNANIQLMKKGVMLINTGRGAIVNTFDIINGLRSGKIGAYGADVYEKEKGIFFFDRSGSVPDDNLLSDLLQMNNVLITPHQGFATIDALINIADVSFQNIEEIENGICENELTIPKPIRELSHAPVSNV